MYLHFSYDFPSFSVIFLCFLVCNLSFIQSPLFVPAFQCIACDAMIHCCIAFFLGHFPLSFSAWGERCERRSDGKNKLLQHLCVQNPMGHEVRSIVTRRLEKTCEDDVLFFF